MAEVPGPVTYTILPIPTTSPRLSNLVAKFRDTKLAALEAEPTGFAVKHAEEVLHPISLWQQRLAAPSTALICVSTSNPPGPSDSDEDMLMKEDWVGMATLRGSLPYSTFHLPESGQPIPDDPDRETRWHLCNLYTSQAHRGRGLAKKLVNAILASARGQTRRLEGGQGMKARVRLFCDPSKTFLVNMYKGMGFEDAGMCTLREAFVANGDEELIPADTGSTEAMWKWERRYGLAMERVVDAGTEAD
ncbi:hypothetical protein K469DRAFT_703188 [Zopfia rhizophila CBS 207.26]|uniref:N-acetyltransferase domain-containing protein n=1 Tax=Zopfia rhizophila CBS 207.26 TaxID=1314779 RepID=A0A6A6ECS8_9PEZI|nr:hypothetical protein K469DRAFT_703188 [Zopfia rhizophila CBS 207.26]